MKFYTVVSIRWRGARPGTRSGCGETTRRSFNPLARRTPTDLSSGTGGSASTRFNPLARRTPSDRSHHGRAALPQVSTRWRGARPGTGCPSWGKGGYSFQSAGAAHAQGRWCSEGSGMRGSFQSAVAAHAPGPRKLQPHRREVVSIRWRGARPGTRRPEASRQSTRVSIRSRGARPGTAASSRSRWQIRGFNPLARRTPRDRHVRLEGARREFSIRWRGARPWTMAMLLGAMVAMFQSAGAAHAQGQRSEDDIRWLRVSIRWRGARPGTTGS